MVERQFHEISGKFDRSSSGPLRKDKPIKMDDLGLFLRNHISIKVPLLNFVSPGFYKKISGGNHPGQE